jgi:hypothetical protein
MSYEPTLDDPIAGESELWRCRGCKEYFHPDKFNWHVDEECPSQFGVEERDSNE